MVSLRETRFRKARRDLTVSHFVQPNLTRSASEYSGLAGRPAGA
jgi:hypothetical protein